MKRILIILITLLFSYISYSQYNISTLAGIDTLKGADTVYHETDILKQSYQFIGFQISYDTLVGSPTGYSILQASIDGIDWATINTIDYTVYASGNDTMNYDIYNVNLWGISGLPFNYYRSMNIGSTGDTLIIKSVYQAKKY